MHGSRACIENCFFINFNIWMGVKVECHVQCAIYISKELDCLFGSEGGGDDRQKNQKKNSSLQNMQV